jgi:hypothetical protein
VTPTLAQGLRAATAASTAPGTADALADVLGRLRPTAEALNVLFVSSRHDLGLVAAECRKLGAGNVLACTTAGEITGDEGLVHGALAGASLTGVRHKVLPLPDLAALDDVAFAAIEAEVRAFVDAGSSGETTTAIVLLDGLSMQEERIAAGLHRALRGLPMVGGLAGDDLRFERTRVWADGAFRSGAGAVALVATTSPTRVFMAHHVAATGGRLAVTAADPAARRVLELDGRPAAIAYADAIGCRLDELTPARLAQHPLILRVGGHDYVRSLRAVDGDGLVMFCALEPGSVVKVGRTGDLVADLDAQIERLHDEIEAPELVLGFDCVLRRTEVEQQERGAEVARALLEVPIVGFSTYGELYGGLHVNQTLTGVAFGR